MQLEENTVLKFGEEEYCVVGFIGQGGIAEVYKIRSIDTGIVRALKILKPNSNTTDKRRLLEEAKKLYELQDNPHFPNIFHPPEGEKNIDSIVMEYLQSSLFDHIKHDSFKDNTDQIVNTAISLCDALKALHHPETGKNPSIHRDLKPENIMFRTKVGEELSDIVLIDLGLVKDNDRTKLTEFGAQVGTFIYMAPEQWINASNIDTRADIFSAGVILYIMATGKMPVPSDVMAEAFTKNKEGRTVIGKRLISLLEYYKDQEEVHEHIHKNIYDTGLAKIICRCLAPKEQRYQTVMELKDDLKRLKEKKITDIHQDQESEALARYRKACNDTSSPSLVSPYLNWIKKLLIPLAFGTYLVSGPCCDIISEYVEKIFQPKTNIDAPYTNNRIQP